MLLLALVAAATSQNTAALDRAVAAFTGRPIGAEGGARTPIDPRLRLAQCPTVSLSWRTEAHDAVVAACTGPDWRIFVAVNAAPGAARATTAAVATPVVAALRTLPVIKRGDPVVIEAESAGFSIAREGLAMGDAAAGARLLIRVEGAKGPVQAVAIAAGRATLPGYAE